MSKLGGAGLFLAALAVGRMGLAAASGPSAEKSIEAWQKELASKDQLTRLLAVKTLGEAGEPAIAALAQALGHDDPAVRYWAAVGLGEVGAKAKSAVPVLLAALKDKEGIVRVGVAHALFKIDRHPEAIPALADALKSGAATVRLYAVHAFIAIGPPAKAALPALRAARKAGGYVGRAVPHAIAAVEGREPEPPQPVRRRPRKKAKK